MTVSSCLKAEGIKLGQTTSVRGVPRIFKYIPVATPRTTRILGFCWLTGVLACFGLLLWQICLLFMRYLTYPVTTQFVQAPSTVLPTFPDITVCNVCPLVHEKILGLSYIEYVKILNQTLSQPNNPKIPPDVQSALQSPTVIALLEILLTPPAAYLRNFDIISNFNVQVNANTTISPACSYFDWNYISPSQTTSYNCSEPALSPSWDPDYYMCYTYQPSVISRQNIFGWSGIFFIDTFEDNDLSPFFVDLKNSRATGLRVAVHPPGTQPDMKLGVTISPGTETTITLTQTQRIRQPSPYSNCTTQATVGSPDAYPFENTTYSQSYCFDVCIQRQYIQECGCFASTRQVTLKQMIQTNFTVCGNLSLDEPNSSINWNAFQQFLCFWNISDNENTTGCSAQCVVPCVEYLYAQSVSSAGPWPHISSELSFYETYISGQPRYGTTYDGYQNVDNLALSNKTAARQALQQISSEGLISSSFLQLKVEFNDRRFNQQKDVPALTIDILGAQMGGVLALWMGASVIVILEVFDFFFQTCVAICGDRKRSKSADAAESGAVAPWPNSLAVPMDGQNNSKL